MKKTLLPLLLLLILTSFAFAADKVRIEAPEKVTGGDIFQVKVIIDEPLIWELCKKVEISCEGNCPVMMLRGQKETWTLAEFNYSGEKELVFDATMFARDWENDDGKMIFRFMGDIDDMSAKYPGLQQYDQILAVVEKKIAVSKVDFSMELPNAPSGEFIKDNWKDVQIAPGFSFQNKGADSSTAIGVYRGDMGRGVCFGPSTDEYLLCSYFTKSQKDNPEPDFVMSEHDYGTMGLSGPSKGYNYIRAIKGEPQDDYDKEGNKIKVAGYEIIYIYEAKVGIVYFGGNFRKSGTVPAGEVDSYVSKSIQEMHTMVSSQRFINTGYAGEGGPSIYKPNLPDIKDSSLYVWGTVSDTDGNPMPYMRLVVKAKGKRFEGATEKTGDFKILLTDLKLGKEEDASLVMEFSYIRDGKNYFTINSLTPRRYERVAAAKKFKIIDSENAELHVQLDGKADRTMGYSVPEASIEHLSVSYYHMHEAFEFALEKLKANVDYKLPVEVWIGNTQGQTHYDMQNSDILIAARVASRTSQERPKNREYHEFAHHLMYAEYGDFATGRNNPESVPHAGFINPNTGDSWTEGFAEFIALAIAKEAGDKKPQLYSAWGDLETNNYKVWEGQGKLEEFAVAALLWDVYDSTNEKGDSLTIPLDEIWQVIKVKRADLYDYYLAFKQAYPKKSKEIDDVFILHGVFWDTTEGNKKYDTGEAWKQTSVNPFRYKFIDLSSNDTSKIIYKPGMVVGKASNYERNRTSAVWVPNAFIKVSDRNVDFYKVKVSYPNAAQDYEYLTEERGGLIYINPLAEGSDATITVSPESDAYSSDAPMTITAKELSGNVFVAPEEQKGHFAEHDFNLKPTGKTETKAYVTYGKEEPVYAYEGDPGAEPIVPLKLEGNGADISTGGFNIWPFVIGAIIIGTGVFMYKKPELRKKAVAGTKKGVYLFGKHGVPFIIKVLKLSWKAAVWLVKSILWVIKKAIELARPHVKKAHEGIKHKLSEAKKKR
ncbi:MAG: hypothetical protein HGA85_07110 [Nanoarchaeota archaeon]|nr:hypothetical protein [Nanoarchaeota archaeon]